jgi:hypothetical protein
MCLRAVFEDGSWIQGKRYFWLILKESWGTHHLIVTSCSAPDLEAKLRGCEIAIPISKPKYWICYYGR